MNKVSYDDYFLTMCFLVAQRSIDPSSKCGAILVSADHRILSTGYNGPIRGSDDDQIPLERPAKYCHMLHAEENCIIAYNGSSHDLINSTMYVTGQPCHKCLRMVLQKGIKRIVVTSGNPTVMHDNSESLICEKMLAYSPNIEMVELSNLTSIIGLLHTTEAYIYKKNPSIIGFDKS